jgi:tetratricopeptide (TPR) repeat protein
MGKDVRVSDFLAHAASKIDERFPDQPSVRAHLRRNIGITLRNMGMIDRAETLLLQGVEDARLAYDDDDPILLRSLRSAAVLYDDQRLFDKSLPMHRQILAVQLRVLGPEHRDTLGSACNVGLTLFDLGQYDEAGEILEATLASMRETLGAEDRFTINAIQGVGSVRLMQGRFDEAEAAFSEARDVSTEMSGRGDLRAIAAITSLGDVDLARGHPGDALDDLDEALARARSVLPSTHWRLGQIQKRRAMCLLELGDLDEAEDLLLESREILRGAFGDEARSMTDEIQAALARLEALRAGAR